MLVCFVKLVRLLHFHPEDDPGWKNNQKNHDKALLYSAKQAIFGGVWLIINFANPE